PRGDGTRRGARPLPRARRRRRVRRRSGCRGGCPFAHREVEPPLPRGAARAGSFAATVTDRRTRTDRGTDAREQEAAAARTPLPPPHAQLLALQRSAGNQAVAAMLQREPAAAPAADEMAKEAMRADVEVIVELLGS